MGLSLINDFLASIKGTEWDSHRFVLSVSISLSVKTIHAQSIFFLVIGC